MNNWKHLHDDKIVKTIDEVIEILLANRGITNKKDIDNFFNPVHPAKLSLKDLGISKKEIEKAIVRIKVAKERGESVIVYGDYDADGVTATAILWEALHEAGIDAMPYIPDRFSEGYGLNFESVAKLTKKNPNIKLIITVDNGIVALEHIKKINKKGVDVIVTDHHEKGEEILPTEAVVHTTKTSGAAVSWILAKHVREAFRLGDAAKGLDLVAIGLVADVLPLIDINRSFAKFALTSLGNTSRPGLQSLFRNASVTPDSISTYHIGYVIAPRINAMGRMAHAMDSLRTLCTKDIKRASKLAGTLSATNKQRQDVVEEVVKDAFAKVKKEGTGPILIAGEDYHEGIIGLAAARLVEEYYRPAIVFSKNGEISKASARSIPGFDIIGAIRKLDDIIEQGGGHKMAAGFSIKTKNLEKFENEFKKVAGEMLTEEMLTKLLTIDLSLDFSLINWELVNKLSDFEPTGYGNFSPVFATKNVTVVDKKAVGSAKDHLKLVLTKSGKVFDAIAFGKGTLVGEIDKKSKIKVAYSVEKNVYNGTESIQLKVKDIKLH